MPSVTIDVDVVGVEAVTRSLALLQPRMIRAAETTVQTVAQQLRDDILSRYMNYPGAPAQSTLTVRRYLGRSSMKLFQVTGAMLRSLRKEGAGLAASISMPAPYGGYAALHERGYSFAIQPTLKMLHFLMRAFGTYWPGGPAFLLQTGYIIKGTVPARPVWGPAFHAMAPKVGGVFQRIWATTR